MYIYSYLFLVVVVVFFSCDLRLFAMSPRACLYIVCASRRGCGSPRASVLRGGRVDAANRG